MKLFSKAKEREGIMLGHFSRLLQTTPVEKNENCLRNAKIVVLSETWRESEREGKNRRQGMWIKDGIFLSQNR